MFTEELNYFISNQDDLVNKHRGKFLVIKGNEVIGVYSSALDAYLDANKSHAIGTFMIQPCEQGPDAYSVTIASASVVHFEP